MTGGAFVVGNRNQSTEVYYIRNVIRCPIQCHIPHDGDTVAGDSHLIIGRTALSDREINSGVSVPGADYQVALIDSRTVVRSALDIKIPVMRTAPKIDVGVVLSVLAHRHVMAGGTSVIGRCGDRR